MTWIQRIMGAVFVIGLVALAAAIITLVRAAEGVPPLPVYVGILGLVTLVLLAGACLAMISVAVSARQGANALQKLAARGGMALVAAPIADPRPFTPSPLRDEAPEPEMAPAPRHARPAGRILVAER